MVRTQLSGVSSLLYHVDPKDLSQVVRLEGRCLKWLSFPTSPTQGFSYLGSRDGATFLCLQTLYWLSIYIALSVGASPETYQAPKPLSRSSEVAEARW